MESLLAEDLLLLALKPSGAVRGHARRSLGTALAGALLVELAYREQALVHRDDVMLEPEPPPLEDELLVEALSTIERAPSLRGVGYWVLNLAPARGTWGQRVAERLVERGAVTEGRRAGLGHSIRRRYPVVDRSASAAIAERLRAAIQERSEPDGRTLVLLSLARACGLVESLMPRSQRASARRRAEELTGEERIGREVSAAVAAVQGAAARHLWASGVVFAGGGAGGDGGGGGGAGGGC